MTFPRYDDIISRIPARPLWWVEGIPRYEPFTPDGVAVGADEVALVHTECQHCGTRFDVAVHRGKWGHRRRFRDYLAVYATLDVGDPPNVSCCDTGYCTTSSEIAILEFWTRKVLSHEWERTPELELLLGDADSEDQGCRRAPPPAGRLIDQAGLSSEFDAARAEGDRDTQLEVLKRAGCERPEGVLNFWQECREREKFHETIVPLRPD